jgi:DNA (cytosine-5)-methyltransferase 1
MGWETVAWCEWNEFGQRVLKHHFPEAEGHGDITKTDFTKYANRIDILTGGFPCQPYSLAGKRKGKADDRHLWPEMLRAIREIQPTWVVGENVFGLINWDGGLVFDEVQADLEAAGYEVWPYVLPACAVNAPHRRDRVWFVAYCDKSRLQKAQAEQQAAGVEQHRKLDEFITHPDSNGQHGSNCKHEVNASERGIDAQRDVEQMGGDDSCANGTRRKKQHAASKSIRQDINSRDAMYANSTSEQREYFGQKRQGELDRPNSGNGIDTWQNFPTQPPICGGDDGLPAELDGITFSKWRNESIKAYGNAIVPQVAFQIFKAIEELSHNRTT